jgi:hypothetical protein
LSRGRGDVYTTPVQRRGDDADRQGAGEVATDLGVSVRSETVHECAGIGLDSMGESLYDLRPSERRREWIAMPAMFRTVQRQHARADDLGRREPRIVHGERLGVAHRLDTQIAPRDHPTV